MKILTQFNKEKEFRETSKQDALRLIADEFKEGDAETTLEYVILTCKENNKVIRVGEIKFKVEF